MFRVSATSIPSLLHSSETWTLAGTNEKERNPHNRDENATDDRRLPKERQNEEYRKKGTITSYHLK